jgi:hypothetical protein
MLTQGDDVGKWMLPRADLPTAAPQNHTVPPMALHRGHPLGAGQT